MAIKLRIPKGIYVELLEIKEKLLEELTTNKLVYEIPFDKTNDNNIKETLISIPDVGIEISAENDIIKYIKSGSNMYTKLDEIKESSGNVIEHIEKIKKQIRERFDQHTEFKIESLNSENLHITLIVTDTSDKTKARMQVLKDRFGDVYIHTIQAI